MKNQTKYFVRTLTVVLLCSQCVTALAVNDIDPIDTSVPVVLTPTRLKQSIADVPGSVTIITSEMINAYAIRSVPEALRFVPGMAVTQINGNDYRVNYHGTNILVPRRMNVLIDGMSVYRSAFALVDWKTLPISMDDIERIEVTRGPNSASYGSNSMLAIINIISKHPKEADGTTIKMGVGTQKNMSGMIRYGGEIGEATTYRVTIERQKDAGLDSSGSHDGTRLNKLNFRSITDLTHNETFDFQAAIVQGTKEIKDVDPYQAQYPDIYTQDYSLNAVWKKNISSTHDIQVQAYISQHQVDQNWVSNIPNALLLPEMFALWQANPSYVKAIIAHTTPSGGSSHDNALAMAALVAISGLGPAALQPAHVPTNQNYNEKRIDIELQDTYVFSDQLRMVSGIGLREDKGSSQTYLGGVVTNASGRIFTNIEYKPTKQANINVGGFFEKDVLTGSSFSPRLALNYHLTDNHTLRFVASTATRMPNIQEQRVYWTYQNYDNPSSPKLFYQSARAPGNLVGEKITSKEIGLFSNFPAVNALFDIKIFEDRLNDLVSEKLQVSNFSPTNSNSSTLRGLELQASYIPIERWFINVGYSYLQNQASTILEQTQYARNSGTLAISHLMQNGWRTSLAYFGYGASTTGQSSYGREDLILSKTFNLDKDTKITPTLTLSYLNNRSTSQMLDFNQAPRINTYNDHIQCYFSLAISF